jgi:hypothetical protein
MGNENVKTAFFQKRMEPLGITEEINQVKIWRYVVDQETGLGENKLVAIPVFYAGEKGIDILVYTIDRLLIKHKGEVETDPESGKIKGFKNNESRWAKNYCLTRFETPIVKKDGSIQKYSIPKGQGTFPFFHPMLLDKYDAGETIDTLFLTEGYFKAWKGCMHGIPTIGLSSITHMRNKDTNTMHGDILKLMLKCNVKRMVWLTDGDCLDVTGNDLKDGIDLYKRPYNFYNTCGTFKQLLDDYTVDKWFFHIDIDNIIHQYRETSREDVKGLDDLLIKFQEFSDQIRADALAVSHNNGWFKKYNITTSTRHVFREFHLSSVNDFFLFHQERRRDLDKYKFVFNGTLYKFNPDKQLCEVETPAEAKHYFRVGDNYYKFIEKINQFGEKEKCFEKRQKSTIQDDHTKDFPKHIPRYEAFCNVPDHVAFQPVHYGCFNVYYPFDHEPDSEACSEGDFPNIAAFFKHIFGTSKITVRQQNGEDIKAEYYQLGYDYVQLLYHKPTMRLPILCLVSKENETGKSTFGDLMKAIFTNNATTVSNDDLADQFNSFWATKLLIMVDETKIDKLAVVERVKSLTFAKKIGMNAKGKDKVEIDFFGKFMMFTNNEENFIYATEEDLRYWVIKVPKIREKNPDFLQNMIDEIPAFLSFLNSRKILAPRVTRMWFDPELLKTEALKKVMAHSSSNVKKELVYYIKKTFLDFGVQTLYMSCQVIRENWFKNKEEAYIERVLKEEMKLKPVMKFEYRGTRYSSEAEARDAVAKEIHGKDAGEVVELYKQIKPIGLVMRYQYPRWELTTDFNSRVTQRLAVWIKECGRPYLFKREDFVSATDEAEVPADIMEDFEPIDGINLIPKKEDLPINGHGESPAFHSNGNGKLFK